MDEFNSLIFSSQIRATPQYKSHPVFAFILTSPHRIIYVTLYCMLPYIR